MTDIADIIAQRQEIVKLRHYSEKLEIEIKALKAQNIDMSRRIKVLTKQVGVVDNNCRNQEKAISVVSKAVNSMKSTLETVKKYLRIR